IALLLPFELDKANQHAPSAADIKRSALALDFYQGFKAGLDALSAEGANFKLNVMDTRDDTGENARIAKLDEVQDAALVVGPVYPKEIQVFGFNAKLEHALQISPLAASMPSEFNLSNLVTITAPLPVHVRSEEHTSELQSRENLVCRLLLEKKKKIKTIQDRTSRID